VRARTQKKVILYARATARTCARESEEEMKKNCFLDTDTKVEDAIFWTNFGLKIGEKEQSNQKKQKEGKRRKNHSNFIRHIFTHNRHTHTQGRSHDKEET
jgi:hypothetical protein